MGIANLYNSIGKGLNTVTGPIKDMFSSTVNYAAPQKPGIVIDKPKFLNAIGQNETGIVKGNPYTSMQPSGDASLGNAMGKYRVTEGELKTYGKRYLGQNVTPQQFLNSPSIQDNYLYNKAQALAAQGYKPEDIADIHNKGIKNSKPAGSGQYQNPSYVRKFIANYYAK